MGDIPLMELLISNQANINLPGGDEGVTVLHEAVSSENPDELVIKYLLENGADPQIKYVLQFSFYLFIQSTIIRNKHGRTAHDVAMASNNLKLMSLFRNIHCKHPANNDQPIAPPVRRRGRTASSTPVIFFTGFDKTRKETLMKSIQSIFGRKAVSTTKNVENNGMTISLHRSIQLSVYVVSSDTYHCLWRN